MPGIPNLHTATIGGTVFDVADLQTVDLLQLVKKDSAETHKLLCAARSPGFFYLDLRNDESGRTILSNLPNIYTLSDEYFAQTLDSKAKDARLDQKSSQDRGYKKSSCDETFEISRDELKFGTMKFPPILNKSKDLISRFSEACHFACQTMLSSLSTALQLHPASRFENSHREGEPSDTGLKIIYEPSLHKLSEVGDNVHTDSGTFTLLFYDQWGLHADLPDTGQWAFIAPKEGCALINVADSLQRLSMNKLHSPRHRVTQPADGWAKRYYISYFLRPEDAVKESWAQAK